jgi:hypothetical protein
LASNLRAIIVYFNDYKVIRTIAATGASSRLTALRGTPLLLFAAGKTA